MSSISKDTQTSPFDTQDTVCKVVVTDDSKLFVWDSCMNEATYWTMNLWFKSTESHNAIITMANADPTTIAVTTDWQRVIATVHLTDTNSKSIYIELPAGTYYFYNSKLEKGNRYSDYSTGDDDFKIEIQSVQTIANGKAKVLYSDLVPEGTDYSVDDTWFNESEDNAIYKWNGSEWEKKSIGTGAIEEQSITNALIADATITSAKIVSVDAGSIITGTLDAERIGTGTLGIGKLTTTLQDAITGASATIAAWCYENDSTYIDGGSIYTGTVVTAALAAGAVTTDKLSANAVTAEKFYCGLAANLYTTGYDTFEQITNTNIGTVDNSVLGCAATITTESPWYGTKCVKLTNPADCDTGIHLFVDGKGAIKVTPGMSYIITVYLRGSKSCEASISARYGSTASAWSDDDTSDTLSVSTEWTRYTLRTTAQLDYLSVYIGLLSICSLYIDAIQIEADASGTKSASDFKPAGTTVINGGNIVTNSITSAQIAAKTITSNEIAANTITATEMNVTELSSITADIGTITAGIIKSENYISNESGLKIDFNSATFDSKVLKVTSTSGTVAGFKLSSTYIASAVNTSGTGIALISDSSLDNIALMAGKNIADYATAPFKLYQDGNIRMDGSVYMGGVIEMAGTFHCQKVAVCDSGISLPYGSDTSGITAYWDETHSVFWSNTNLLELYNWAKTNSVISA